MKNNPKVSVIIPVYNVAPYLARCLDSIIGQTLQEIEIICIDDKSTDNSLEILRKYEKKDARIKVIAQDENGGAAVARNAGLSKATGEYLGFVDPDDYIDLNFYENLYSAAHDNDADLAKAEVLRTDLLGNIQRMEPFPHQIIEKGKLGIGSRWWWSLIYKHNMIKNYKINFPEGIITSEDVVFLDKSVIHANKVITVANTFYHYIRREGSLDPKILDNIKIISKLRALEIIVNYLNENVENKEIYNSILWRKINPLKDLIFQTRDINAKIDTAKTLISLWSKAKYKDVFFKVLDKRLSSYLESNNNEAVIDFMLNKLTKVSVIIPVYNVAPYLARCLDSIIGQTLQEIEIICIDDKSTDNSLEILRKYEKKDARIKVIALDENGGAAVARNAGLSVAIGEYIGFVDPDDYIDLNFYENLYYTVIKDNADIAKGNMLMLDFDGILKPMGIDFETIRRNKANFYYQMTSAIYNHALIREHHIQFIPEIITAQDVVFLTNVVLLANKVVAAPNVCYYYVKREGSLDSKILNTKKIKSKIEAFKQIAILLNKYLDDKETYLRLITININYLLLTITNNVEDFHDRALIVRSALDIWNSRKFKDENWNSVKKLPQEVLNMLNNNAEVALFKYFFAETEIIISLTSYPARIPTIHLCIETLLNQSKKADRVILWLARPQFSNGNADLPTELLAQKELGLEIEWLDEDIRSYKKLIPALEKYPDALIITADDDLFYPKSWLQDILNAYNNNPNVLNAIYVDTLQLDDIGNIVPFERRIRYPNPSKEILFANFAGSGGGVAWKKEFLDPDAFRKDLFTKITPYNDDVWFWAMVVHNNIKIKHIEHNYDILNYIPGTQEVGLWQSQNKGVNFGSGYDNNLVDIINYYPDILRKLYDEQFYTTWKGVIKRVHSPRRIDYYLFGIINLISKQKKKYYNKYKLFGFLPILGVRKKEKNNYIKKSYKLFNFLPLLVKKQSEGKQTKYKLFGFIPLEKILSIYKEQKYGIYYCNIWFLFIKLKFRQNNKTIIHLLNNNREMISQINNINSKRFDKIDNSIINIENSIKKNFPHKE